VRHARYTFSGRWADRWRVGRVVLAGDAAHQMPPFLGQGLNSGIRDAANLAWRLALLVAGEGKESLLDDYAAERSTQVAQIVEETVAVGQLMCLTDREQAALLGAELKRAGPEGIPEPNGDWPLRGGTMQDDGIGGTQGLQAKVATPVKTALLDEVIAPLGFVLLGRDRDPAELLSPDGRASWQRLGGRSAHFGPGGLEDAEFKYGPWFDLLRASVVVIRPDFHVFGGVLDANASDSLVQDLADRVLAEPGRGRPRRERVTHTAGGA
jgi:hypothetical protein